MESREKSFHFNIEANESKDRKPDFFGLAPERLEKFQGDDVDLELQEDIEDGLYCLIIGQDELSDPDTGKQATSDILQTYFDQLTLAASHNYKLADFIGHALSRADSWVAETGDYDDDRQYINVFTQHFVRFCRKYYRKMEDLSYEHELEGLVQPEQIRVGDLYRDSVRLDENLEAEGFDDPSGSSMSKSKAAGIK